MSDSTFDAGWLSLREPVDHRSRAHRLTDALAVAGARHGWRRVVDLGGGTGSNVRYLAPRLPWARTWSVVDHDPDLLDRIRIPGGIALTPILGDLAREGLDAVDDADVVTASALLDLVSADWLARLVERCARSETGVLLALSYDGTVSWDPEEVPADARVRAAFNEHQGRDKGLGAALGPAAAGVARDLFRDAGFHVQVARSPWVLRESADAPLARSLLQGWFEAAVATRPTEGPAFAAWAERRRAALAAGTVTLRVGHLDVLALPARTRG